MGGLWGYALGTGMTNKFNQILDEKRRLKGQIELEQKKNEFSDDTDPLADKFAIKGTDIIFNTPNYERDLKGSGEPRKALLQLDSFYSGALDFTKDQWDAAKASNKPGYDDFKRKFLGNAGLYWKRHSQTTTGGNTYKDYDYSGLQDRLPDLYRDLQLLDPGYQAEETVNPGIAQAWNTVDDVKIRDDMSPSDVIIVPFKFDKNNPEATAKGFDDYYGKDFGKNVMMSSQYADISENDYNNYKGESPWTILIPTYQWMVDNNKILLEEGRKEIAQMQLNYGLSDEALIDVLAYGTKKHNLKTEGGYTDRTPVTPVATSEYSRVQNAKSVSGALINDLETLQKMIMSEDVKVGLPGWINRFYRSVFKDRNSMVTQFRDIIGSIEDITDDDLIFAPKAAGQVGSDKDSLFKGETYGSTASEVKDNILKKLYRGLDAGQEFYNRADNNQYDIEKWEDGTKDANMGTVTESMIETMAIGLAFRIAMLEQGSGGKAVSDQDFDRAYQRVKGKWFSSKEDVIASLNLEKHRIGKQFLNMKALEKSKAYGSGLLDWYSSVKGVRDNVLEEYRSEFNTLGVTPLAERTERILKIYQDIGGTNIINYRYGVRPDALDEEGFQNLLSNFTKSEAKILNIKLSDKNRLKKLSEENRKIKITKDGDKVVNDVNGNGGTQSVIQSAFASDLVNKHLKDKIGSGIPDVSEAIDAVIDEIRKDPERKFFANDDENALIGTLSEEKAINQLRMKILRQWMEKYQTFYDVSDPLASQTRTEIGLYGKDGIPADQDNAVVNKLWGKE